MKYTTKFIRAVENGVIPEDPPFEWLENAGFNCISVADSLDALSARTICTKMGMWAIVDLRWTKQLANWIGNRKCLEVMSGVGWLAKALCMHGINIIATDSYSWEKKQHKEAKRVYPVERIDAIESVKKFQDRDILIVSWPPYTDETICKVCDEWGNDKFVIYIGEGEGGCCAPGTFWQNFRKIESHPSIEIPRWWGIHDHLTIGRWERLNVSRASKRVTNSIGQLEVV
jgi:hypothetical protein